VGEHYDYPELWELLRKLVAAKQSGTLFIKSDDAHASMISLRQGEITSIFHQSKQGQPAMEALRQIAGGTYRFDPNATGIASGKCPPTPEILRALAPDGPRPADVSAGTDSDAAPLVDEAALETFLIELKEHLQAHLGPIAPMLLEETLAQSGKPGRTDQARSLIDRLAEEIEDEKEASAFVGAARDSLRKAFGSAG